MKEMHAQGPAPNLNLEPAGWWAWLSSLGGSDVSLITCVSNPVPELSVDRHVRWNYSPSDS